MSTHLWPGIAFGLFLGLLALLGERTYRTYQWAGEVNLEAKAAAGYLGAIVPGITKPDGSPIRRYELIDVALQEYISTHKAPASH